MSYTPQGPTWSEFVALVTGMLTVDANRAGLETFRTSMIRQGVIDLQNAIDGYRIGHETVYLPSDLVKEGRASRGVKPPQSVIQDVWMYRVCPQSDNDVIPTPAPTSSTIRITGGSVPGTYTQIDGLTWNGAYGTYSTIELSGGHWHIVTLGFPQYTSAIFPYTWTVEDGDNGTLPAPTGVYLDANGQPLATAAHTQGKPGPRGFRYPTDPWDWGDRFALVNGKVAVNNGRGLFCIDPHGYTFYLYPELFDRWLLSIHWSGLKLDFKDDEETPFDEPSAMAVAEFVKAKIAREVDRDVALHDSYMRSFALSKQKCFVAAKERGGLKK